MEALRIEAPILEPVSLEEAKADTRVDGSDQDATLTSHIATARAHIEAMTDRQMLTATWELLVDGWPADGVVEIPVAPVQSIESVVYTDPDGVEQTLAPALYRLRRGEPARLVPAFGQCWPAVRRDVEVITIRLTAGYGDLPDDVPPDLRTAVRLRVMALFDQDQAPALERAADALAAKYRLRVL